MSKLIGVGIVGAGDIFRFHADAFAQLHDKVRIVSVADVSRARLERVGQRYFVPFPVLDYCELIARQDVDLVVVCTPPNTHEQIVGAALEAGKHVVCEKPLTTSLAAGQRMKQRAAVDPGRVSTVFQRRFDPRVRGLLTAVQSGALGAVEAAECVRVSKVSRPRSSWWGSWDVAGGGVVINQFIHDLDLLLQILGPASEVTASMSTLRLPIEAEDTAAATIRFQGGAVASCLCGVIGDRPRWRLQVHGTEGGAGFERAGGGGKSGSLGGRLSWVGRKLRDRGPGMIMQRGSARKQTGHFAYCEAVVDAMSAGRSLPVPIEDGYAALELVTGIYASAIGGQTVRLPITEAKTGFAGWSQDHYSGNAGQPEPAGGAEP